MVNRAYDDILKMQTIILNFIEKDKTYEKIKEKYEILYINNENNEFIEILNRIFCNYNDNESISTEDYYTQEVDYRSIESRCFDDLCFNNPPFDKNRFQYIFEKATEELRSTIKNNYRIILKKISKTIYLFNTIKNEFENFEENFAEFSEELNSFEEVKEVFEKIKKFESKFKEEISENIKNERFNGQNIELLNNLRLIIINEIYEDNELEYDLV